MKGITLGFVLIVMAIALSEVSVKADQMSYRQLKGEIVSYDNGVRQLTVKSKLGDQWVEHTFELTESVEVYRYMLDSREGETLEKYVRLTFGDLKKETSVTVLYRVQDGRNLALSIELHL
jgi:hypothetical protein